jgi:tetratricopeptide (TPR) repeat protein
MDASSPQPVDTARVSGFCTPSWLGLALAIAVLGSGCDELKSRREVQRGNEEYNEGRYQKAVEQYELALERTPSLTTGHHNAALAYYKMFEPGSDKPRNREIAEKAATHFQAYLAAFPGDTKIVGMLTQLWLDSNQYEKGLAYWEKELAKDPSNRDILVKLANINRQAGQYDKALEWHYKRAELEPKAEGKVNAYVDIAQLEWSRLNKTDLVDEERVAVADLGIAALEKAEALDPKNALVQSLMGSIYQHRSMAHGASWAKLIETTSQRFYASRFVELQKAGKPATTNPPGTAAAPKPAK